MVHNVHEASLNDMIIKDLAQCMSGSQIIHAYQQPRSSGRMYAYSDVLRESCSLCFRWRDGVCYVFDGRVWIPYDVDMLKYVIRDALVSVSGAGSDIVKSDWVQNERKMFGYALDGIKCSLLPYNGALVGFSNGVWDFSDICSPVKYGFSSRQPVTRLLGYRYDPSARCPVWLSFLSAMLSSDNIDVLRKFMALGCADRKSMGRSVEESLWLIGDGANGKTTIQNVIRLVFGDWNVGSARLDSLLDRNVDARLRAMGSIEGKVFNMCSEISGVDLERGSDVFKSLVSGEPQEARVIGRDIHTAYDIPYFIFSMNRMPSIKRLDKAFMRRMVRIDFRSSVRREDMDRGLLVKLAAELPGIRNWVIGGWSLLERDGFRVGKERRGDGMTDEELEMYIMEGKTVEVWLTEWAFISASRHVGHEDDETAVDIRSTDLYSDYYTYCQEKLLTQPVSVNMFGRVMMDAHFEKRRTSVGNVYRVYCDKDNRFNIKEK